MKLREVVVVTSHLCRFHEARNLILLIGKENLLFGMKSKKEKLEAKLAKLMQESYELSHTNRRKSDEKAMEAEELRKQIDLMD